MFSGLLRNTFEDSWLFELLVKDGFQFIDFRLKDHLRLLVLDIDLQLVGLGLAIALRIEREEALAVGDVELRCNHPVVRLSCRVVHRVRHGAGVAVVVVATLSPLPPIRE